MSLAGNLSETYHEHLQRVRTFPDAATATRFFRRNFLPLLADLPEGRILEIGCGIGEFLRFAVEVMKWDAVGVDLSAEHAAACREQGFDAVQGDAVEYLRGSGPLAAVVMNDVLEHIPCEQVLPLLSLIHERLVPAGRLVVKVPNMSNPITGGRGRFVDFTHVSGFTEESLQQVLENVGFAGVLTAPVDLYVTSNPVLNALARAACAAQHASWRLAYRLNGVPRVRVLTKGLIACGVKAR